MAEREKEHAWVKWIWGGIIYWTRHFCGWACWGLQSLTFWRSIHYLQHGLVIKVSGVTRLNDWFNNENSSWLQWSWVKVPEQLLRGLCDATFWLVFRLSETKFEPQPYSSKDERSWSAPKKWKCKHVRWWKASQQPLILGEIVSQMILRSLVKKDKHLCHPHMVIFTYIDMT